MCNRFVGICAAVFSLLAIAVQAYSDSFKFDVSYEKPNLSARHSAGLSSASRQSLDNISISGFCSSVSSGDPALPCKIIYVALPPDADISSVKIDDTSYYTQISNGKYDISPVPASATADGTPDWGENKQIVDGRNQLVYEKNEFYPNKHLSVREVGSLRSWKITAVEFWPYCFNPSTGELRQIESSNVSLSYNTSSSESSDAANDVVASDMADFVSNKTQAECWYTAKSTSVKAQSTDKTGYAIITTDKIVTSSKKLQDFVSYQIDRGFDVNVETEGQWGGGVGDIASENIRNWLKENYQKLNIEYVLLIGNPDPTNGDVPMKMLWPRNNFSSYKEAPSDYYYADLTGNWDLDGDGYYGETPDDFGSGGIDVVPEVYVGRIPNYGNTDELDHILQKIIDYGSTVPPSWRYHCLLAMKPLDINTPAYQLGEQINSNILSDSGFTSTRIYDSTYNLSSPPDITPCDYSPVQYAWLKGAGLVFWMTHGSINTASGIIYSNMCTSLDDSMPSIVYQGSCNNGDPEDSTNLGYSLLKQGAIATVCASRVSWYYIGEFYYMLSDSIGGIGYQYAKYLSCDKETCGHALEDAKLCVPESLWPNHLVFNLYGDPSLAIDTTAPGKIIGIVAQPDGSAIKNAIVKLPTSGKYTTTADDGTYSLSGIASGLQNVDVSASGYYSREIYDVPITPGNKIRLDVCMTKAVCGSISGYVLDESGTPLEDAFVKTIDGADCVSTLSDGSFLLSDIAPGTYTVIVDKYPYAEKSVSDVKVCENLNTSISIDMKIYDHNTIANGGFEDGFINSPTQSSLLGNLWKYVCSSDYSAIPAAGTSYHKYGSFSQMINMPQPAKEEHVYLYQTADIVPGGSYTIMAWARTHFGGDEDSPSDNIVCRLGYDLTGGNDVTSSNIMWMEFCNYHDFWNSLFKTITPYSKKVSVFLDAWRKLSSGGSDCYVCFDGVALNGPALVPSVPKVCVNNKYQCDKTSISASWSSSDTDIASYEYAVSTTSDESGIIIGGDWKNAGLATSTNISGLNLKNGDNIRVLVRAINSIGLKSEIGASDFVRIIDDEMPKSAIDNNIWVHLDGLIVSRMGFDSECFVQDANRTYGLELVGSDEGIPYLKPGTKTSVVGCLTSKNGMKVIENAEMEPSIVGSVPRPLGMLNSCVCRDKAGLAAYGLLVTVWGRVGSSNTAVAESGCFTIDDGSVNGGINVECYNSAFIPSYGSFVRITGIATPDGMEVFSSDDIIEY